MVEECAMLLRELTGGSADLQKAFDQIQRLLVYALMHNGGDLKRVTQFLEELEVMNAVGDGVGAPYKKATSIPQG